MKYSIFLIQNMDPFCYQNILDCFLECWYISYPNAEKFSVIEEMIYIFRCAPVFFFFFLFLIASEDFGKLLLLMLLYLSILVHCS